MMRAQPARRSSTRSGSPSSACVTCSEKESGSRWIAATWAVQLASSGGNAHVQTLGSLLRDRALVGSEHDLELAGGRLRLAHLHLRARHVALVVEPVEEVAVVLGQ